MSRHLSCQIAKHPVYKFRLTKPTPSMMADDLQIHHQLNVTRLAAQMSGCLTRNTNVNFTLVDRCRRLHARVNTAAAPHLRLLALVGKSEVQMPKLPQKRGREESTVDGRACRGQVVRFVKACNLINTKHADLALYELSPIFAQVVSACDLDAGTRRTMVCFGIDFGQAALSRIVPAPRQLLASTASPSNCSQAQFTC